MKRNAKPNFKSGNIYISLEDIPDAEWIWSEKDIIHFDILWGLDMPVPDIARQFRRSETSIVLLAFDRALQGKIVPRQGWNIW